MTLMISPLLATAGFLEMPDISEVPDLERQSMLRDLDIPSVRERSPDPEAGPRLAVSAFRLQGIVEFPELGITRAELDRIVEDIRHDLMAEDKLLDSGYTLEELGEISDMLVKIEDETLERHVTSLEVQQLVWLVRDQRSRRGITLGQIESIADKITRFYRERGFILAKAYIPKQQVRDGVVNLTMLLGLLGEVRAIDNTIYSNRTLESVFEDMLAKPVTSSATEERLYLVNDYPGVTVQGFFEPGAQVGDTRLNIKVNTEQRYNANLRLDNHGSEQTGEYRLYGEAQVHNPLGNADQLHLGVLQASSPSNTTYGQFKYQTRLFSPRTFLTLGIARNQFVLGPGNSESINLLQLSGETTQQEISALYKLKRSRVSNYSLELKTEAIESQLRLGALPGEGDVGLDDEVRNASLTYYYDILQEKARVLHQGNVSLTSGEFVLGADEGQDETYSILSADYTFLTFWKLPVFESNTRLIARTSLQATSSALSSINQFSLAGPTRARGYPVNQYSADNAIYLGAEWIFNSPEMFDINLFGKVSLGDISQPFLFIDYAYGEQKSLTPDGDNQSGEIMDIGFGIKISYLNDFKGNLQFAFPLNSNFSSVDIAEPEDSMKIVFDFQYSFL